jgi:DNA-binding transcriptional LysR family regulator
LKGGKKFALYFAPNKPITLGMQRLQRLPAVNLRLLNLSSAEIASGLAEGTLDLGLLRADAVQATVQTTPLGRLRFSLFVPLPLLPGKRPVVMTPKAMARVPLAMLEGAGAFRTELERLARRSKVVLTVGLELSSFPLVARAVQAGVFAAILPSLARKEFDPEGVLELEPDWLRPLNRDVALAWNPRLARIRRVVAEALPAFKDVCRMP